MKLNFLKHPVPSSSYRLFKPKKELELLIQTPRFLVINKPSGLAVHPNRNITDSVESRLMPHPRGGPWLAHRLDQDTAGCLLIARRKTALIEAQQAFQTHQVRKIYWAIVVGTPQNQHGEISLPLLKQSHNSKWKIITSPKGKPAKTIWRLIHSSNQLSWLELELLTGRTHQARVHCAALGTPILGDAIYGKAAATGLQLLARKLDISLRDEKIQAIAPPPTQMEKSLKQLGLKI